jgi:hypothetical protein
MTKASAIPGSMTSKTIHEAFACNEYCEYERITDYFEYGILRVVLKDIWTKASIHNRDSGTILSKLADRLLDTALEIIKTTANKAKA